MKKKVFLLTGLILVLSSTLPIFSQVISPGPVSWDPDLTSSGVAITEPFKGYLYNPYVVHGGTLTVATPSDPPELHQWNAGATASYDFLDFFNDYLTRTDPVTGAVVPWIAESWEVSEDKLSYVVHLTEGVLFHDGVELTAEDVKFNFDFIMENNFTRMSDVWQRLSREKPTEIIDDYTLRFHVAEPYVPFARETLGMPYIYPKHIWGPISQQPDFDWLTYVPSEDEYIGCGPFKYVDYVPNAWYKFEAFDDYWHGKPYLDEIVRPIITSGDAELLAVKRGEVDIFTGFLASEAIPGLLREEGIGLYLYNNPYMYHWGMNTHKWPFSVKEFRFALAHAIDKLDIVDTLLLGYGLPGTHGVEAPFYEFWFNPDVPETYYFDLDKAAKILDDLGWVDTDDDGVREGTGDHAGEPLAFDIGPPIYDPVRVRAAELLSEWFAQIGVDATVQYMEWATLWGKITQPLDSPTKIDTWLLGSSQSPEPTWMHTRLHSDNIPNPNYYGFVNAEYDELALLQGTQFDSAERQESIWRMQEILAEEIPLVVLYFRQSPSVYRNDELTGWVEHFGAGMDHFWNYINLRPIVEMKSMSVSVVSTPPPELEIGDEFTLKIKYTGPEGPITTASVYAMLTGDPTPYQLEHVGSGTYECDFDTSDWHVGKYWLRVEARATGFISELTTFTIEVAEPYEEESNGAIVTGVVVVLVVIVVAKGAGATTTIIAISRSPTQTVEKIQKIRNKKELERQKKEERRNKKIKGKPLITWSIEAPDFIYKQKSEVSIKLHNVGFAKAKNITIDLYSIYGLKLEKTHINIPELDVQKKDEVTIGFQLMPFARNGLFKIVARINTWTLLEERKVHFITVLKTGLVKSLLKTEEQEKITQWLNEAEYHWDMIEDPDNYINLMGYDLIFINDSNLSEKSINNLTIFAEMGNKVIINDTIDNQDSLLLEPLGYIDLARDEVVIKTSKLEIVNSRHPLTKAYKINSIKQEAESIALVNPKLGSGKAVSIVKYKLNDVEEKAPFITVCKLEDGHVIHLNYKIVDKEFELPSITKNIVEYSLDALYTEKVIPIKGKLRKK